MAKQLKKFVRYDGNRQLVPGSMIERYTQPKGKFEEVVAPSPDGCCVVPPTGEFETYDGYWNESAGRYAWPTYYLSSEYEPPFENGVFVMPIHSAQVASTYVGRTGTVPSQPQGAVQMYFYLIDANNIDWSATDFLLALTTLNCVVTFIQNGVGVSYITNPTILDSPAFSSLGGSVFHDEVFGTNPASSMVLLNESQSNVAFNTKDPITIKIKIII
jgi:hypothetical protein